jgi:hypothetical protein
MMLGLTDEETAALTRLLTNTINDDRYPLSLRIQTLKAILNKIRPEPTRQPAPPLRHYDPPRAGGASLPASGAMGGLSRGRSTLFFERCASGGD